MLIFIYACFRFYLYQRILCIYSIIKKLPCAAWLVKSRLMFWKNKYSHFIESGKEMKTPHHHIWDLMYTHIYILYGLDRKTVKMQPIVKHNLRDSCTSLCSQLQLQLQLQCSRFLSNTTQLLPTHHWWGVLRRVLCCDWMRCNHITTWFFVLPS